MEKDLNNDMPVALVYAEQNHASQDKYVCFGG
jgi:hypothetical protein